MPFARKQDPDTGVQLFFYTPTSGSSITGSDDNGNTLAYTVGEVMVWVNGSQISETDFTATDGSTISGLPTFTSGDEVTVLAFNPMNIADAYTKTAADNKYALLGANSDITSLTGITTPLSEAQGGTGLTSLPTTDLTSIATSVISDTTNTDDLGSSSKTWKDLYLGGNLYLGGTGAANAMDDYEEGTWTPAWGNMTVSAYAAQNGSYTKIGRQVTASFSVYSTQAQITSKPASILQITGLPFTALSENANRGVVSINYCDGYYSSAGMFCIGPNGGTVIQFYKHDGTDVTGTYLCSYISAGNALFEGTVVYYV